MIKENRREIVEVAEDLQTDSLQKIAIPRERKMQKWKDQVLEKKIRKENSKSTTTTSEF